MQSKRKIPQKYNGFKMLKMPVLCIPAFFPLAHVDLVLAENNFALP